MKVEILRNLGTNHFPESPFKTGEIQEVGEALGEQLIKRNLAREIIDLKAIPPVEIKARPEPIPSVESKPELLQEQPVVAAPQPVVTQPKKKEK